MEIALNKLKAGLNYQIWRVPIKSWLIILLTFLVITFRVYWASQNQGDFETVDVVAEIEDLWNRLYFREDGDIQIYYIRFREGAQSRTCRLSPIMVGRISELKVGQQLQLSLSISAQRCFVYDAAPLN